MKKLIYFSILFLPLASIAQKTTRPDIYAKTIRVEDLQKHLYIIASAEMEGREATTEGERKAAAYIENEFRRIGLEPGNNGSYRQFFPVYKDSLVNSRLEVNGVAFQPNRDFNADIRNIDALHAFSEALFIGPSVSVDSVKSADVAGRLVIITGRGHAETLRSKGAAVVLTVSPGYPRTSNAPLTGNLTMQSFRRAYGPQSFMISENVSRAILGQAFDSAKLFSRVLPVKTEVRLEVQKQQQVLQSSNVLGILRGRDLQDQYIFITAHYDHEGKRGDSVIYYGADDDGSGTVSIIELAEAFATAKKAGQGPRRSIVFMAVSGEEKGLWGSAYYGANPVYPLEKTTVNLNIDMIGRIDPTRKIGDSTNYVYVVGDDKISSDLRPISEAANKKYTKLELDYKFNDPKDPMRIYYRSDHYNFAKYGVPIIFYFNGVHRDYHRPTDTPDKINYPLLAKRAQLVFYTAWEMANRNDMLRRDRELPALTR